MHLLKKWRPLRPACLHKGQDRTEGSLSFDAVERKILASVVVWISFRRESNAWEISGLREARDLDRSSVP